MLQTLWYNHIQYYTAYYMYKGKGQYYNRYMYVRIMYTITCIIMHLYMYIVSTLVHSVCDCIRTYIRCKYVCIKTTPLQ